MNYHLEAREIIESQVGKSPKDIYAVPSLSTLYGSSSLVCHLVRPIDDCTYDAYFLVGENICGPQVRPPMFDRLVYQDGKFITQTSEEDAAEHLINTVGKGVIAGHNLAGLFAEAGILAYNQSRITPLDLVVTSYDFVRFKGQVLPDQELIITGTLKVDERSIQLTPTMTYNNERRAMSRNLRLEVVESLDEEIRQTMMAQHWFPELTAQGLGVSKAHLLDQRMIPIFLECDSSWFAPIPVRVGDLVRTRLSLFDSEDNQAFANSETFVRNQRVVAQEGVLLEFFPIEQIFPGST